MGGATHHTEIVAKGYPTAGAAARNCVFKWYRATAGGQFDQIAGVSDSKYTPTISDIGARICCQWVPLTDGDGQFPSNFAEWGPIALDPSVLTDSTQLLATGHIAVSGAMGQTAPSAADRKSFNLLIDRERILIETLPSGDVAARFSVSAETRIRVLDGDSKHGGVGFGWTLESTAASSSSDSTTAGSGGARPRGNSDSLNGSSALTIGSAADSGSGGSAAAAYGALAGVTQSPAPAPTKSTPQKVSLTGYCDTSKQRDVLVYLIRHLCEEAEESVDIVAVTIELAGESSESTCSSAPPTFNQSNRAGRTG